MPDPLGITFPLRVSPAPSEELSHGYVGFIYEEAIACDPQKAAEVAQTGPDMSAAVSYE